MRRTTIFATAAYIAAVAGLALAGETNVQTRGKIVVAPNATLVAVSTDPVVQRVLNDDFYAAGRGPGVGSKLAATLTVTLSERLLKPGVSLNELAPGDPAVVALLRAAGAEPPPVGDTGNQPVDPYENVARMETAHPDDPALQEFRQQQAFNKSLGMGGAPLPAQEAQEDQSYDRVIIARVTADERRDQFIVVAVAQPGDDVHYVKKLVAEEIANAALH
jgi:hypothetical protein